MEWLLDAQNTYFMLLITQAAHLFHHRIMKKHISFVEVIASVILCIPPQAFPGISTYLALVHIGLVCVQIVGSIFIQKLSPDWRKDIAS